MTHLDINELKHLFTAVISMGNACGLAFEDKKIGLSDLGSLMDFAGAANALATSINFELLMPEIADLDQEETAELAAIVEDHFDIPEDLLEEKVKQIFGLAVRCHGLISEAIAMVRNPDAVG